jgi:hypothetical protein
LLIKSNEAKKVNYLLIGHIETRFGDPITSISLNSRYCIIGTMFGKLILYTIKIKEATIILEHSEEEILNINFSSNNNSNSHDFYCCVGDKSILKYSIRQNLLNKNNQTVTLIATINNYSDECLHVKVCDNALVFCTKEIYFMVAIEQLKKKPMVLNTTDSSYIIKNVETMEIIEKGFIKTTNYIVPFDFDGKYFILLQFFTVTERMLCSFNVITLKTWKHLLREDFGVLNYCKFINDNKVFIVRKFNLCEIRIMDDNFTITHSFQNIGDKVIGLDFFYKITKSVNKSTNVLDLNKKKDKDDISETETKKLYYNNNLSGEDNLNSSFGDKNNILYNSENIRANTDINFILLDVDGNVNFYNVDKGIKNLFNVNKVNEIDKSIREKGLFSLNYPYMIKYYHPFLAISTDDGCYIFQLINI